MWCKNMIVLQGSNSPLSSVFLPVFRKRQCDDAAGCQRAVRSEVSPVRVQLFAPLALVHTHGRFTPLSTTLCNVLRCQPLSEVFAPLPWHLFSLCYYFTSLYIVFLFSSSLESYVHWPVDLFRCQPLHAPCTYSLAASYWHVFCSARP